MQPLSLQTNNEILVLLALQLASYRVEADLIGFDDIPPLKDGIESLREAKETFYGYYVEEVSHKLVGAISFAREGTVITICRMMVHPDYFRRGIARSLLQYLLGVQQDSGASRFIVSTGTANVPAIQLYESLGFVQRRVFTVPPGVCLTTFERPAVR
ncbi:GNAT family N-acetyltransferase [Paenibacillus sp. SYP-B3998]|uniref:GNAT family N-acetyltransferase n=1 Tax=Paenibacillus sp. SYP-B3998 TaxID=2678564 RepID=A0A6G4A422_9BACL|nr:GNAT family N-acetyltransferase [Paenibacillus sp. SYP-B3998]